MNWIYGYLSDYSQNEYDDARSKLSPSRRNRIERLSKEDDVRRSLLGEILLKKLLCKLGKNNEIIQCDSNGRPYLEGKGLHISITHSGNMVACAIDGQPIGIDAEMIRPIKLSLINRVCNDAEAEYILPALNRKAEKETIDDDVVLEKFFSVWTSKEAIIKKSGKTIADIKSIDSSLFMKNAKRIDNYIIQII